MTETSRTMIGGSYPRGEWIKAGCIVGLIFLARLAYALTLPLHPDEAYYWMWSMRPDFAYYDQGPGTGYYILIFTTVFGDTHFALKLAATIATLPVLLATHFTAFELGVRDYRRWILLGAMTLVPGFLGGAQLIMHDTPLIICWSLSLYFMVRYLKDRRPLFLLSLFLFLGLGALSKHSMGGFAMSLVGWFLVSPREYGLLRSKYFWLGVGITLLVLIPELIWNLTNDWGQVEAILFLRSSHIEGEGVASYIAGQALTFSPLWVLALLFLWAVLLSKQLFVAAQYLKQKKRPAAVMEDWKSRIAWRPLQLNPGEEDRNLNSARRFLMANALVLPLLFLYLSNQGRSVQANWLFPAYAPIIIWMMMHWPAKSGSKSDSALKKPILRYVYMGLSIVGLPLTLFIDSFLVFSKQYSELWPHVHPYWLPAYRIAGYEEPIRHVEELRREIDPTAGVIANRYQDAAIAQWYLPDHEYVTSVNVLQRNQYNYWPHPEKGRSYFLVFINENTAEKMPTFFVAALHEMFEEVRAFPEETVYLDGKAAKRYQIWYGKNYREHWYAALVKYMNSGAIHDLMPNMRGGESFQTDSGTMAYNRQAFQDNFLSRAGCAEIIKPDSIWERIELLITTGREGICVEIDPDNPRPPF